MITLGCALLTKDMSTETVHPDLYSLETSLAKHKFLACLTVLDHAGRCFSSIFSPPESPAVAPFEANTLTDITSRC